MTDFKAIVNAITKAVPDVIAIYCFGSTGTKYETPESDLDIAILPSEKINPSMRFELADQLMSVVHKDFVDIVDLLNAPPALKKEVFLKGKRIFCKDEFKTELFEDRAFVEDLYFNEERRMLVEDILKRGSVY